MSSKTPHYITTAISYVNGRPTWATLTRYFEDAMARFKRLDGYDVHLTGTDEHGQKVEKSALDAGQELQVFTDEIAQYFRDMCALLNISNDDFIRTTDFAIMPQARPSGRGCRQRRHLSRQIRRLVFGPR